MQLSRPVVALAGAALAGIALVGVGASATFTASTSSGQKITAGTLNVVAWAPEAPGCRTADAGCQSLTLPDVGPVGSTFETPATHVFVTNKGDIPAFYDAIQITETDNGTNESAALKNQSNICIMSHDPSGTWVEGNGPLLTALALNPTVKQNPVQLNPGESGEYWVSMYAGKNSACGTTVSDGSHTRDAWTGLAGPYQTPASLTNAAQGGSITPVLTFSFTG